MIRIRKGVHQSISQVPREACGALVGSPRVGPRPGAGGTVPLHCLCLEVGVASGPRLLIPAGTAGRGPVAQQPWRSCEKCAVSGPTLPLLTRNLHVNETGGLYAHHSRLALASGLGSVVSSFYHPAGRPQQYRVWLVTTRRAPCQVLW